MLKKTLALLILLAGAAQAATYPVDDSTKIVGKEDTYKISANRHHDYGVCGGPLSVLVFQI